MPFTSSVVRQSISNFRLYCLLEKNSDVAKKVTLLLEQPQVCIFAEIVFGVRCTLRLVFTSDRVVVGVVIRSVE